MSFLDGCERRHVGCDALTPAGAMKKVAKQEGPLRLTPPEDPCVLSAYAYLSIGSCESTAAKEEAEVRTVVMLAVPGSGRKAVGRSRGRSELLQCQDVLHDDLLLVEEVYCKTVA